MTNVNQDLAIAQTVALITRYGFDLGSFTVEELMEKWLKSFHSNWIRLATIEALYLGRYKAISVEQILTVWLRLGNPNTHFSHEFERLISRKLPRSANLSDEVVENTSVEPKANLPKTNLSLIFESKLSDSTETKESKQNLSEISEQTLTNLEINKQINHDPVSSPSSQDAFSTINFQDWYASSIQNEQLDVNQVAESESNFFPASALGLPHQPNASRNSTEQNLIHKFTPLPDFSSFYHKLKSLAQRKLEEE